MSLCLTDDYNTAPMQREIQANDARKEQLRKMIQSSYSVEEEAQVATELNSFLRLLNEQDLSDLVNQRQISGPLAHLLAKFLHSSNMHVVHNVAIVLSQMMRGDVTRRMLCKSGLDRGILMKIQQPELTREIVNELYSCVQNILVDGETAKEFASRGGLMVLGDSLQKALEVDTEQQQQRNVALEIILLCCMANAMSHIQSEMEPYTHEMRSWIANLLLLLSKLKLPSDNDEAQYCVCAIANASRDPGLLHCIRASNGAEHLERMRFGDDARIREVADTILARLQFNGMRQRHEALNDEPFRFRFGGGKITRQQRVLGLWALLMASTVFCSLVFLAVWRVVRHGSYF